MYIEGVFEMLVIRKPDSVPILPAGGVAKSSTLKFYRRVALRRGSGHSVLWLPAADKTGGVHLSGSSIALGFKRHSEHISELMCYGTALHPVRILPFHLHVVIPIMELSLLRWDGAFPDLSDRNVSARTSMLTHDGC